MTFISALEVFGVSDGGAFLGKIPLKPGLNVLSARNSYGKSLALRSIPWCLGLEPMFGLPDGDASLFPEAGRSLIQLEGEEHRVTQCNASIELTRGDDQRIRIVRPIVGANTAVADVLEFAKAVSVKVVAA